MKGRKEHERKRKVADGSAHDNLSDRFGCEGLADRKGKGFTVIENERIRIYPAEKEQMERLHPTSKYHMMGWLVWQ